MADHILSVEDVNILFDPNFLTTLVERQKAKRAGTRPTRGHSNDVDSESIAKILNRDNPENEMARKWLDVALGQDRPALDEEQARVAFMFSYIRYGQEKYQGATEALSHLNKVRKDRQYDTRLQVDIRAYLRTKRLGAKEERMSPELPSPRTNKKKRRLSSSPAGSVRTRSRTRDTDRSTSPMARRSSRQRTRSDAENSRVKAEDLTPADALSPKRRSKKQKTKKEVDTSTRAASSASVAGSSKRKRDDVGDERFKKRIRSEDTSPAFSSSSPGSSSSKRKSKRQKLGTKDGADAASSLFVSTQRRSERVAVKASKLVKEEDDTAAPSLASASTISPKHRKRHADPKLAAPLQPSIPSGSQEIAPHVTADGPSLPAKHDKRHAKKMDSDKGNKTLPDPSSIPPTDLHTAAPTVSPSLDPSQPDDSKDAVSVTETPALHAAGALPASTPPKREYKKRKEKAASAPLPSPHIPIAEHASTSASAPPPSLKSLAPENELPIPKQESELDGLLVLAEANVEVEELPEQSRVLMGLGLGAECNPPINRPAYPFKPPVWAQSRQEVCEAFPWFRSYQGGVYFSQGHAKGYLLSKFSSLRDGWFHQGKLIISHGGGKAESVSFAKGKTEKRSATDQKEHDKSVTALLNNYRRREPLVLLIDDHYVHFPFDLKASNYAYVALGFYFISDVWMEYQPATNDLGRVVRYKFAFQWCGNQGEPWWCSNEPSNIPAGPDIDKPKSSSKRRAIVKKSHESEMIQSTNEIVFPRGNVGQTCQECKKQSPQVYTSGWMCLYSGCSKFWRCGVDGPMPQTLAFNPEFLQLLDEPVQRAKHEHLKPGLPVKPDDEASKLGTGIDFTRGWHCSDCGRLSCRYRWKCWECPCCHNTFGVSITKQRPIDLTKTLQIHAPGKTFHAEQGIKVEPHKLSDPIGDGNGRLACDTFILPDNAGSIHRISVASKSLNKRADKIFDNYQAQASDGTLEFRRWPMRAHKCRGALLTNYFSHNCGEPYHYVGGADNTVPWEGAPSAVVDARALIQAHLKQALNIDYEFNEVLSAAYMEDQSMAFHSDSEKGLDSIVAGLSLGSPAKMIFRLHAKYLGAVKDESGPQPTGRLRPNALTILLQHGDVLVMEGAGIQERYEHTVIPGGFRIAATARKIGGQ